MMTSIFEGFTLERVDAGEAELRVRHGGSRPPLLLLHGHPRTHVTWHKVAPLLAGHDRGSYVAFRTAMDHPDAVTALAVLDSIPIGEALSRADARFASAWWHWFFFGQTSKPAETIISRDPDAWYTATADVMGEEAFADYRRAIHHPEAVHAMVEDYRAGLTVDRAHDDEDRAAGRRLRCPTLVAWSIHDDLEELWGDPVAIWRDWADDVRAPASRAATTWPSRRRSSSPACSAISSVLASRLGGLPPLGSLLLEAALDGGGLVGALCR
jgi:haloacetate dehalogenase